MPSKAKPRSPIKKKDDNLTNRIASLAIINTSAKKGRGPIPTKKFSGPLPPEEEIKLPQKKTKPAPATPKAKAATPAAKSKSRARPVPRVGSPVGGRELAGLLTDSPSVSDGKRSRNMSEAAMLRLAAELDQAEMREYHRQKKALDEEIRAARAASEVAAEPAAPSSSSRSSRGNRALSETAAVPKPAVAAKSSKPAARAAPAVVSPPRKASILRDEKKPPKTSHRGLSVSFGAGKDAPRPLEKSESEDAPAPKRQKVVKAEKPAVKPRPTRVGTAPSASTAVKNEKKEVKSEDPPSPTAVKRPKEPLDHGELSAMNKARREAMRDSQQIVDECPSCRIPLITNPILKTIDVDCYEDRDNMARPHFNRKMCVGNTGAFSNGAVKTGGKLAERKVDVWSSIRSRIIDKFELGDDIPNEFFIPNTKKVALRNQYLTPDILMAASDFQRATEDLPKRCKLQVCAYPTWAKDVYFRLRRAYEKQVQIMIDNTAGSSSSSLSVTRPTRVRCHCDKYNLQRCGDRTSSCCSPEMLEMEARALIDSDQEE